MDYIPSEGLHLGWLLGALVVVTAGVTAMVASALKIEKSSEKKLAGVVFIGGLLTSVLATPPMLTTAFVVSSGEQRAAAAEQANTTYGTSLTREDMGKLEYPGKKPTQDFQVFGKIQADNPTETGFTRTETFLIWRDGKMLLAASQDGENFSEISKD
jgi:hypothetical protein